MGPHEGFYVSFPQAETRTAWIESVAELSAGGNILYPFPHSFLLSSLCVKFLIYLFLLVDGYREFEYLSSDERLYTGRWFAGKVYKHISFLMFLILTLT